MRWRVGITAMVVMIVAAMTVACGDPAQVEVQAPLDRGPDALPDGITVSGTGEVQGAPDTLTVDLGVTLKRASVGDAVGASAEIATAVVTTVKEQGVAEQDVQTRNYSVTQEYRYPEGGTPIPDGFRVTNTVTVKVRDLARAGSVIDAATAAGGDDVRVDRVAFSLEDDGPALTAAREKAFRDAQAKAEQYAELADRPVGAAQAISDVAIQPIAEQYSGADAANAFRRGDTPTPIQPGEVTTVVTVNARFTLD